MTPSSGGAKISPPPLTLPPPSSLSGSLEGRLGERGKGEVEGWTPSPPPGVYGVVLARPWQMKISKQKQQLKTGLRKKEEEKKRK